MKIAQDSAVLVHYHLTDSSGVVIDSSMGKGPMAYLHGHNNLVPGVEQALFGQEEGAQISVEVPPADGYGKHDPSLDVSIPLSVFPPDTHARLQPGVMFEGPHPSDRTRAVSFRVLEVTGSEVRCTANHPLAGMTLHFNLKVLEVREATADELSQGHVLSPNETASSGCCSDPNCGS